MPVPNTGGSLKTSLTDMKIGDYIKWGWVNNTDSFTTEIPVTGIASATDNQFHYMIKVDKGLLVSDRVVQNRVSWDTINANKGIQGKAPSTNYGVSGFIRSLGGGNAYADIKSIIPVMTSNTAPAGVASASGVRTAGTEDPYIAFNGVIETGGGGWHNTPNQTSGWLQYKFDTPKTIKGYSMMNWLTYPTSSPKDWVFQGSNNGVDWVSLDTQVNQTCTDNVWRTYFFKNNGSYLYYRINISANNGYQNLAISELKMYDQQSIGNYIMSTTDKGMGAYPPDNEWEQYIVRADYSNGDPSKAGAGRDDVWHWKDVYTWVQDTYDIALRPSTERVVRGYYSSGYFYVGSNPSSGAYANQGFRPVFEYQEV